jgi:hypothetical protein
VDGTLSGGQSGTERLEFLFDRDSGLVVRTDDDTAVRADTTLGTIDYRDHGRVTLAAMSPRT